MNLPDYGIGSDIADIEAVITFEGELIRKHGRLYLRLNAETKEDLPEKVYRDVALHEAVTYLLQDLDPSYSPYETPDPQQDPALGAVASGKGTDHADADPTKPAVA